MKKPNETVMEAHPNKLDGCPALCSCQAKFKFSNLRFKGVINNIRYL
jgi:hypothetical protein